MSANELTAADYTWTAVTRAATNNGNGVAVKAAEAMIKAAPAARPDLNQASRSDLRDKNYGAFPRNVIPLVNQAFETLLREHLGDVTVDTADIKSVVAVAKTLARNSFDSADADIGNSRFEPDVADYVFHAVADLAIQDGYVKEVAMAEDFVAKATDAQLIIPETRAESKVPQEHRPANNDAFSALAGETLTGKFSDGLASSTLEALRSAATAAAHQRFYNASPQPVAANA